MEIVKEKKWHFYKQEPTRTSSNNSDDSGIVLKLEQTDFEH